MRTIEEIEIEEIKKLEPDYRHYAKLENMVIVEFSLVIHRINPSLYNQTAIDMALMFLRSQNGLLLPPCYVPEKLFRKKLEEACQSYNILNCIDWNGKYGQDYFVLKDIPMSWLILEANKKELPLPDEFMQHIKHFDSGKKIQIFSKGFEVNSTEKYLYQRTLDTNQMFFINNTELVFQSCGEYFDIQYNKKKAHIKSINGLVYIAYLLKNPNKDLSPFELYSLINKILVGQQLLNDQSDSILDEYDDNYVLDGFSADNVMDKIYKDQCQIAIQRIDSLLKEKPDRIDANVLLDQKKFLVQLLKTSSDGKGQSRNFIDNAEKIRQTVSKAIHLAFNKIKKQIPELTVQLENKIRSKDYFWKYSPD